MTNLEILQKQQLEAMNQMYAQTLNAAAVMSTQQATQIPVQAPQNNTAHLENQLAEMQANMQQMMQIINQQQQMIQAQQMVQQQVQAQQFTTPVMPNIPAQTEPVVTKHVAEPAPVTTPNEDIYKVSSKLIKPCETCPFAQTCPIRTKQDINEQCGQEVLANKRIMLQGGKMQARYNFESNEIELLANGKLVSVVQDIKSNHNKKFINFMVKNNQVVDVLVVSDQKQPNSIYTTCTVEVLGFAMEDVDVMDTPPITNIPDVPMPEPVFINEESEETYLSEDEMSYYDSIASTLI